ncbi:MAG: hypothetical protein OXR66_06895 [Candidatus Woesearchaeota archaeon]|nr:hypothetical protein [Candidatus Woesearchaeota archaeon]
MAKKKKEMNQLNLTIVALVSLVAIVGLVSIVVFSNAPTGVQHAGAGVEDSNVAGQASDARWGHSQCVHNCARWSNCGSNDDCFYDCFESCMPR